MEIPPAVAAGLEVAGSLEGQPGLGGGCQVRGTADQPGDVLGQSIEDLARRDARGDSLGVRRIRGQALVPAVGKLAMLHLVEVKSELRVLCLVLLEPGAQGIEQLLAATADALFEVIVDALGNQE